MQIPAWINIEALQGVTDFMIFFAVVFLEILVVTLIVGVPIVLIKALIQWLIRKDLL